ncbi:MAG: type III-A CRISPR-associated protein Csm2 [Microscillaceae bacterium]|jgi:CRISPR-associated protein Csm2|nr:type III-A CRISPR-associated protein Csm2 [Microscillaceae bacterium]
MAQQNYTNKGGGGHQQNNPPVNYGTFDPKWISEKINMDCIDFTEKFGGYLAKNGLTTSQIRNVYGEVKRIELSSEINKKENKFENGFDKETSFLLLKPKIAYAAKRKGGQAMDEFKKVMNEAHKATQKEGSTDANSFKRFCEFFEAILAYHKAEGGRDS